MLRIVIVKVPSYPEFTRNFYFKKFINKISHLNLPEVSTTFLLRCQCEFRVLLHFTIAHCCHNFHFKIIRLAPSSGYWCRYMCLIVINTSEDGVAQSVEHWTANLAARVRSPAGEEPSVLMCAFLHVQMESNWAGLSVCNCLHTGKWCDTKKAIGNTDHTRQTWIHMQTPLSPLAGCGPVGEGTSGKVLNWTVRR